MTLFFRPVFIGLGNLAGAVARRLGDQGHIPALTAIDHSAPGNFPEHIPVNWVKGGTPGAIDAVRDADVVFVGVKPQHFPDAAKDYAGRIPVDVPVISFMAALTPSFVSDRLGGANVAWMMTNMAARHGRATTAVCSGNNVPAEMMDKVRHCADALGDTIDVPQVGQMHDFTATCGSGPALVASLLDASRTVSGCSPSELADDATKVMEGFQVDQAGASQVGQKYPRMPLSQALGLGLDAASKRSQAMSQSIEGGSTLPTIPQWNANDPATLRLFSGAIQAGVPRSVLLELHYSRLFRWNCDAGFGPGAAERMTQGVWRAAIGMVQSPDPAKAIEQVVSPQGTTQAGFLAMAPALALSYQSLVRNPGRSEGPSRAL